MEKTYPDLPSWIFVIEEVSVGVYKLVGRDNAGNTVSQMCFQPDYDAMIESCRVQAKKLSSVE